MNSVKVLIALLLVSCLIALTQAASSRRRHAEMADELIDILADKIAHVISSSQPRTPPVPKSHGKAFVITPGMRGGNYRTSADKAFVMTPGMRGGNYRTNSDKAFVISSGMRGGNYRTSADKAFVMTPGMRGGNYRTSADKAFVITSGMRGGNYRTK